MKDSSEKKTKIIAAVITAVIISGLLFGDIAFYNLNSKLKGENRSHLLKIDSLTGTTLNHRKEVQDLNESIVNYKFQNHSLEEQLTQSQSELKIKTEKLGRQSAIVKNLEKKILFIKKEKNSNEKEMKTLLGQLEMAYKDNESLKKENYQLSMDLSDLQARFGVMEKKVRIASALRAENIMVVGEKKLKNGKYNKIKSSKKTDRMLVTFDVAENRVTEKGEKKIYIRILDPTGNLVEGSNSGSFQNIDKNMSTPYTFSKNIEYSIGKQRIIFPIDVDKENLKKGVYRLEFFCDGYYGGTSSFKLK